MKFKIIIVSLVLICSLLVSPTKLIAQPLEIVDMPLMEQIEQLSLVNGIDVKLVKAVIKCESGFDNSNIGDSGLSRGILQFQKSTFIRMSKLYGEELNYDSQFDQLKLGIWALSKPELAREWTAYRAIKNGGTYSFYSKQLKKHFTVTCRL